MPNIFTINNYMGRELGKSTTENFSTKIKISLHFNLIATKIRMQ